MPTTALVELRAPSNPAEPDESGTPRWADREAVWAVAAQLTSGLLANPTRSHCSVKDSIALFDQVLHEVSAYARVRGDFGSYVGAAPGDAFTANGQASSDSAPAHPAAPAEQPRRAESHGQPEPRKPAPQQPAPWSGPEGALPPWEAPLDLPHMPRGGQWPPRADAV